MQLLSVVMPSLNQAGFIEAAIASVLGQDYRELELIVADGGSTDGTVSILKRLASRDRRLRWTSEPDRGPAQAVNKALASVNGTVVGWLNADDLYTPGAASRALNALEAQPHWLMVYGRADHVNEAGHPLGPYPTLPPSSPRETFADGCFICQPTVFFRRPLQVLLGRLDESLGCAFDFDWWLRAFRDFPERIGFVDALQAQSRLHEACITVRQRRRVTVESMRVIARHLGRAPAHWVMTYVEELVAGKARCSAGTLRDEALLLLDEARNTLGPEDYAALHAAILADARLAAG